MHIASEFINTVHEWLYVCKCPVQKIYTSDYLFLKYRKINESSIHIFVETKEKLICYNQVSLCCSTCIESSCLHRNIKYSNTVIQYQR